MRPKGPTVSGSALAAKLKRTFSHDRCSTRICGAGGTRVRMEPTPDDRSIFVGRARGGARRCRVEPSNAEPPPSRPTFPDRRSNSPGVPPRPDQKRRPECRENISPLTRGCPRQTSIAPSTRHSDSLGRFGHLSPRLSPTAYPCDREFS